jgi:hypothetical protein
MKAEVRKRQDLLSPFSAGHPSRWREPFGAVKTICKEGCNVEESRGVCKKKSKVPRLIISWLCHPDGWLDKPSLD